MCYLIYNGVEFSQACFAISNIPEERIKILKSETELNMLPGHCTDVFKRNNVDRYINRPNKCFAVGTIKC